MKYIKKNTLYIAPSHKHLGVQRCKMPQIWRVFQFTGNYMK